MRETALQERERSYLRQIGDFASSTLPLIHSSLNLLSLGDASDAVPKDFWEAEDAFSDELEMDWSPLHSFHSNRSNRSTSLSEEHPSPSLSSSLPPPTSQSSSPPKSSPAGFVFHNFDPRTQHFVREVPPPRRGSFEGRERGGGGRGGGGGSGGGEKRRFSMNDLS